MKTAAEKWDSNGIPMGFQWDVHVDHVDFLLTR